MATEIIVSPDFGTLAAKRAAVEQVRVEVSVAYPDLLSLEDAARAAFAGAVPTPREVVAWCDEYTAILRARTEEARGFANRRFAEIQAERAA